MFIAGSRLENQEKTQARKPDESGVNEKSPAFSRAFEQKL